jgi:glucuronoarabinoxylan endo-1,4-beta-xylanase
MSKVIYFTALLFASGLGLVAQQTATVSVNAGTKAQDVVGFGAAIAYFDNWLTAHPNKADIYRLIFSDLNLQILRIRNVYGYTNSTITDTKEIVQQADLSLGHPVEILMSSWSPPARLKAGGITNGGTLLSVSGQFVYTDFAQWWYDSLLSYAQAGITPTYINMQNEPDYENTGWETCIFKNVESTSYPGYGVALSALYAKLQSLPNRPKILGPEVAGIGFSTFQNYTDNLNRAYLDGYAYHLYNGGDVNNPDSFNVNLNPLKTAYTDKPNIMTEFSGGTWFQTAWLIQNCLVNGNAAGYLYWDLVWGRPYGTGGLVSMENPWEKTTWTTTTGYVINPDYYALKHFSKFISKGYSRVDASTANANVRPSAFLSPDGSKLVAVILNVGSNTEMAAFSFSGFAASSATGVQSVDNNYYYPLESVLPSANVNLPARSVTTLEYTKGLPVAVESVSVSPASVALDPGSTALLTAVVLPSNATNKTVSWSSASNAIATVNASGLVTGVNAGTTTVTAETQDGGKIATATITVTPGASTPCANPVPITLNFSANGVGEFCGETSGAVNSVNSWNMQLVEINGVSYTNRWSSSLPPRINGKYYIHYVGSFPWSHFEINGTQ